MNELINNSRKLIIGVSNKFKRYLFNEIDAERQLIGIKGARGSGKTTLLLQLLSNKKASEVLYISLDSIYFSTNSLIDLASEFSSRGGKYLYIDEVHKYPNWSQEIKNIYDSLDDLNVVFTSSSALEINKGKYDLSRRAIIFDLVGLSFREFMEFKYSIKLPKIEIDVIINNHEDIAFKYLQDFKPLKYFPEYLKIGYYPFFKKEGKFYHQQLAETINIVIETDLPAIYKVDYNSVIKLKRLLFLLGGMVPYVPNVNKLALQVGTTRDSLLKYLHLLHNSHILSWLSKDASGINFMNKPDKLYLNNTNISYALSENVDIGTLRETFFLNQLSVKNSVTYPKVGDFMVDNKYLFEVGGKNKTRKQIVGIDNSFVVSDNIEVGLDNKIPLWLFGFMY
ncbi:MAG: ATP-binding protein [Flavobacteriales bacterium]|nr:ATP-binding protein [Flavobacteriales bacterium]